MTSLASPLLSSYQAPCKPRPTPSPLPMAPSSLLLSLPLPISLILRPSMRPLSPRFCSPTTALISPFHVSLSSMPLPSPNPLSDAEADVASDAAELTSATVVLLLETEVEKPFVVPFVPDTPLTPLNAIPEPPPAAMAAALKIAAVFLLSNKT